MELHGLPAPGLGPCWENSQEEMMAMLPCLLEVSKGLAALLVFGRDDRGALGGL